MYFTNVIIVNILYIGAVGCVERRKANSYIMYCILDIQLLIRLFALNYRSLTL
jgi:hypothetical protein